MEKMTPEVSAYLDEVGRHLHLGPAEEKMVLRELYTHLEERIQEFEEAGLSPGEAAGKALDTFGRSRIIARRMYEAHSKGSWVEATFAALPSVAFALVFALGVWHNILLTPVLIAVIAAVTIYEWWHSKPSWLYPWIGYSLLPLLVGAWVSTSFLWGNGSLPSIWAVLVILGFVLFSVWAIFFTTISVAKRDWILASLMLVPLPVFGGWLLELEREGGLLRGSSETVHGSDINMFVALISLAVTSAAFIRLRQRVMKVGALVALGTIALAIIAYGIWGGLGFFGFVATALVLLAFVLSPALIETRLGHGKQGRDQRWAAGWLNQPSGRA